jgi:site-specific DNA-adenine methylase
MRPFFSYYGAKYTVAKYAGPPRRDLIIEPFAGSAAYSVRYAPKRVMLYDINPDICDLWDWLINCSVEDVRAIPDRFESIDDIMRLSCGPSLLVRWWISKGRAEPSNKMSPWYFTYRDHKDCKVWGSAVKSRIIYQKPLIKKWKIDCLSYEKIPLQEAHWFIDPPYNNSAGSRYPFSKIDYMHLATWAKSLPGTVDVFENEGATWLYFRPLCSINTCRGKRTGAISKEVMARFGN